jgi:hypothetical protein
MRPFFIKVVSREIRGLRRMEGESARAAKTKARFVTDFEPGMITEDVTGLLPRKGAGQSESWEIFVLLMARAYRWRCAS